MGIIEKILCKVFNHEDIGRNGSLYMRRWFIYPHVPNYGKSESRVYLHKFYRGDDDDHPHNHPWAYKTLILKGGYWEESFNPRYLRAKAKGLRHTATYFRVLGRDVIRKWYGPGSLLKRGPSWAHRVILPEGKTAWTLVRTGPKVQSWGFITESGFCNHNNYHNGVCWCDKDKEVKENNG